MGGQNGVVLLPDNAAKQRFINSIQSLIDKYGFDGIDIDLESGIYLNGNDTNFKNPTTSSNRKSYFGYSNNLRSLRSRLSIKHGSWKQLMFKAVIAHTEASGAHIYRLFTE
ncbi:glycosyl hydrolase family 18 protein [Bacillus pacificus]